MAAAGALVRRTLGSPMDLTRAGLAAALLLAADFDLEAPLEGARLLPEDASRFFGGIAISVWKESGRGPGMRDYSPRPRGDKRRGARLAVAALNKRPSAAAIQGSLE